MNDRIKRDYKEFYDIIQIKGNGAYGSVYEGKEKITNKLRAIKVIDLSKIEENLINSYGLDIEEQIKLCIDGFINEFENMKICSQGNINSVECYEFFNNEKYFVIIMELCDKNLLQLLTVKMDLVKMKYLK